MIGLALNEFAQTHVLRHRPEISDGRLLRRVDPKKLLHLRSLRIDPRDIAARENFPRFFTTPVVYGAFALVKIVSSVGDRAGQLLARGISRRFCSDVRALNQRRRTAVQLSFQPRGKNVLDQVVPRGGVRLF